MHLGIDLGSRTIKVAAIQNGVLRDWQLVESGFDPHAQALTLLDKYMPTQVTATGYGRHLARKHFAQHVITEIKAHALGARHYFPDCRLIVDVGGQDSKVIALDREGRVLNFQMNDKCAAGTGRFLEIMATSLGYRLGEFGEAAAQATEEVVIGSMCAVFAESEVVSLRNRGCPPEAIARAIHRSVVDRLASMLERIGLAEFLVFSGGVARNSVLTEMLSKRLGIPVVTPERPEIVGALGAALHGVGHSAALNTCTLAQVSG